MNLKQIKAHNDTDATRDHVYIFTIPQADKLVAELIRKHGLKKTSAKFLEADDDAPDVVNHKFLAKVGNGFVYTKIVKKKAPVEEPDEESEDDGSDDSGDEEQEEM